MLLKAASRFINPIVRSYFKKQPAEAITMKESKKFIVVPPELTLEGLAQKLNVVVKDLIPIYQDIEEGANTDHDTIMSRETAEIIINEYNYFPLFTEPEIKLPRPPVVTIMGHLDHGKTTLLDALRNSSICATEFGGITQGIGAFTVKSSDGNEITFIDTPGHLAFKNMRSRGAQVTDIIILVVCAVEGVQPQTMECIEHAMSADVPIIVALNKIDLPAASVERVELQLVKAGLELDKYGGDVLVVPISAKKKIGLDKLEETIAFKAELMELTEAVDCLARGYILESKYVEGKGSLCSVIVRRGTLKIHDNIVAGSCYGSIKQIINEKGVKLQSIGPAQAAEIVGFKDLPNSGESFLVTEIFQKAIKVAKRKESEKSKILSTASKSTEEKIVIPTLSYLEKRSMRNNDPSLLVARLKTELENVATGQIDPLEARAINQLHKKGNKPILDQIESISKIFLNKDDVNSLRVILKAQNFGMLEAVEKSIQELSAKKKVKIHIIRSNVGGIVQEDLELSEEYNAPIFCMNIKLHKSTLLDAAKANISLKSHKVIYHLLDDIENMIKDITESSVEIQHGKALVKSIFEISSNKSKL